VSNRQPCFEVDDGEESQPFESEHPEDYAVLHAAFFVALMQQLNDLLNASSVI